MSELVRLNANENMLGPSPLAVAAMQKASLEANLYPTDQDQLLIERLIARIDPHLTADNFVLGHGSGDVLRAIAQTYILPGMEVIVPIPTFAAYKRLTLLHRGQLVPVPLKAYQVDLMAVLAAITPNTALIFICNPNNPTGQIITHEAMAAFLSQVPERVVVVVDEAYLDFVDDPAFPRMTEFIAADYNLIVARTFSKVYGLASLRLGYGFGSMGAITPVQNGRNRFEIGRIAYAGAAAALNDEEHVVNTIEMVQAGREYFYEELSKLGISYLPSQGIFLVIKDLPVPAPQLVEAVLAKGVIIRHMDIFDMPGYIRISIGRPEDNAKAIAALAQVLQEM
jgi:histidinol-phosphate aminotransferase